MERTADRRTLHFSDEFHFYIPSETRSRPPSLILFSLGPRSVSTTLPADLTAKADLSGNEYGWRPEDFLETLSRATSLGLACLGGQFQFRVPGGTCEIYWRNADSGERAQGEEWADYVVRSEREVRENFTRLLDTIDFRRDAQDFDYLQQQMADAAFDPLQYLFFVAYFVDEREHEGLTRRCSQPPTGEKISS